MLWNPDTCWSPYQGAGVVMAASAGSANGSGIFSTTMRGLTPSGVVDSRSPHSTCSDVVVMNCGHSTSRSAQAFVSPGLGTRNFKRPFEPLFYGVENESRAWRRISPRIYFLFFLVVVFLRRANKAKDNANRSTCWVAGSAQSSGFMDTSTLVSDGIDCWPLDAEAPEESS